MAEITFTIDDLKLPRVTDAIKGLSPIPQINAGTEESPVWENEFTDNEWAKESVRRYLVNLIFRHESNVAREASIPIKDDSIVS